MSRTSKSPRMVLRVAYYSACRSVPLYASKYSRKDYTQPQLLACLVLMRFFARCDYRGLSALLQDCPLWCQDIGLTRVPHFTTFHKASRKLLRYDIARSIIGSTLRLAIEAKLLQSKVKLAAIDSTGFESHHVSFYFVRRRSRGQKHKINPLYETATYTRFPKAGVRCDCRSHLILAITPTRGPAADQLHLKSTLQQALSLISIDTLLADAGYDGEHHHRFCREVCGVRSIIPPKIGRPSNKPPAGKYRRLMHQKFPGKTYHQRWQVETVNSMIKRRQGSSLHARSYWPQCREILLRAITHNVMILLWLRRVSTE